ncbi:MAG: super-infection exclusion protein B [Anaerolineae bacterium]
MLKTLVSLLLSFLAGVAGNLIAGWIQEDVWLNVFTLTRILVTLGLALVTMLLITLLTKESPVLQRRRDSTDVTRGRKPGLKEVIQSGRNALDNHEKAVLREFFIKERNTIMVPEEDAAVARLLQNGIIHTIGEGRYLLGVGWVCPVALSPIAEKIIKGSSPQVIGFPPGVPTPEQIEEIKKLRPGFVLDIEMSSW